MLEQLDLKQQLRHINEWVVDHTLTILISQFLSHQLYFTFKFCICLEYLISPFTTVDIQMKVFLMGQFKFNFSGITSIMIFQQISMKFCYCFKLILFCYLFKKKKLLLLLPLNYTDLTFWLIFLRLCFKWDLRRRQQTLQPAFFHAARPLGNYYISVQLMSAKSVLYKWLNLWIYL